MIIFYIFVLYCIYSIFVSESKTKPISNVSLIIICIVLAVGAGLRDKDFWFDTPQYLEAYRFDIKTLFDLNLSTHVTGYNDKGFIFLSSLLKTIYDNETFYLLIISLLTFVFLYIDFRKFSLYPLIGVAIYIARFFIGRNLMQIRAGLSIAIVVLCIYYVHEKKLIPYLIGIIVATLLHSTMIIVLPFYWINKLNITKKHVLLCIIASFLIAIFFAPTIKLYVSDFADDFNYTKYIESDSSKAYGFGLANPMIYYQCFILFMFTFYQEKIQDKCPYYFELRNAYLYSTILIIVLSQWAIASGRLSTIFATLEIGIIPSFLCLFGHKSRWFAYIIMGGVICTIMYLNLSPYIKGF